MRQAGNRVILSLSIILIGAMTFNPAVSQAKGGDEQDQIILLNDSAAALEDSNPGLSKSLTKFAQEKEIDWELNNANKNQPPLPAAVINPAKLQGEIDLLKASAVVIEPTYPIIAKSLKKMAKDLNRIIENER